MILCMTPFDADRNLGRAYNEAMQRLPPGSIPSGSWAVFLDHDAMWTTPHWHRQISEAIVAQPDAGAFTACANRIYRPWQQAGDPSSHDIVAHRAFGAERTKVRTLLDITDADPLGGVVLAVSRDAWDKVGGFADGMACVDHMMHLALARAGLRVYLIEGLYVYHWRRATADAQRAPMPRASGCPCRGRVRAPTSRVTLP